jgi:hypothetical protein
MEEARSNNINSSIKRVATITLNINIRVVVVDTLKEATLLQILAVVEVVIITIMRTTLTTTVIITTSNTNLMKILTRSINLRVVTEKS